jgi:hypothetical protein
LTLSQDFGHRSVTETTGMTFPRKPDSFELEVGRFPGLS